VAWVEADFLFGGASWELVSLTTCLSEILEMFEATFKPALRAGRDP